MSLRWWILAATTVWMGAGIAGPIGAAAPDRTTATYGNWELRCETRSSDATPAEACEIVQTNHLQGQAQPVSQIAVGRPTSDGSLIMVLQLPIGIWLPAGVGVELGEEGAVHQATMKLCVPTACIADLEITEAMLATLQENSEGEGRIVFATAEGRAARLPIMFRGFASAYEALTTRFATE